MLGPAERELQNERAVRGAVGVGRAHSPPPTTLNRAVPASDHQTRSFASQVASRLLSETGARVRRSDRCGSAHSGHASKHDGRRLERAGSASASRHSMMALFVTQRLRQMRLPGS